MTLKSDNIIPIGEKSARTRDTVLETLFREHEPHLRLFLRVRLRCEHDVDDVIQDVYIRLARVDNLLDKVNRRNGSTRAYILSIASNLIIDRARRAIVRQNPCSEMLADDLRGVDSLTPERHAIDRQRLGSVKQLLMTMPSDCRRALLLSRINHMTYRQIAREMSISPRRVEKLIGKSLVILREGMAGR